jgi:MFS family permease
MLANLQRDLLVLMISRGVRAFAFSYLSVVFAIYLNQLGYSTVTIGLVISTASASGAVLTALWGFLSDRYGRKNILMLLALLTMVSNTIYIFFSQLFFIFLAVIIANVGTGGWRTGRRALQSRRTGPVGREMHGGEPKPDLLHQRLRRFSDGLPGRVGERSAGVSTAAVELAAGGVVQAALRPDLAF